MRIVLVGVEGVASVRGNADLAGGVNKLAVINLVLLVVVLLARVEFGIVVIAVCICPRACIIVVVKRNVTCSACRIAVEDVIDVIVKLFKHIVDCQLHGRAEDILAVLGLDNVAVICVFADVFIQRLISVCIGKVVFEEQPTAVAEIIVHLAFCLEGIFLFAVEPRLALVGRFDIFKQLISVVIVFGA